MLSQPLIQQLQQLRLRGMAAALEQQLSNGQPAALSFEERLGIMIQHEITERASARLTQRLRWARLPQGAVLEDLNTAAMRGLDPATLAQVRDLAWIGEHLNVLITGPTGVGKSFVACALAHSACRADYAVRFFRLPRLIDELARVHALHNRSSFFRQLAKVRQPFWKEPKWQAGAVRERYVKEFLHQFLQWCSMWFRKVDALGQRGGAHRSQNMTLSWRSSPL